MDYGEELILDIHHCNSDLFTIQIINEYFAELCNLIDMERVQTHWWVDDISKEKHLSGISAVQFIKTSNITIHCIRYMQRVYVNIFSCKEFDSKVASEFTSKYFEGKTIRSRSIRRI